MNRLFMTLNLLFVVLLILALSESTCHSQTKKNESMASTNQELINRKAVVSGQFYPGSPAELSREMDKLFMGGSKDVSDQIIALIAPHAGYVFSGAVAAKSFMQIDRDKEFENIFLIGSSHHVSFDGASIYSRGNFETPLGVVPVNIELAEHLIDEFSCFSSRTDAHQYEHSLEVQLPFLQ